MGGAVECGGGEDGGETGRAKMSEAKKRMGQIAGESAKRAWPSVI